METIYEQIDHVREQLAMEAGDLWIAPATRSTASFPEQRWPTRGSASAGTDWDEPWRMVGLQRGCKPTAAGLFFSARRFPIWTK